MVGPSQAVTIDTGTAATLQAASSEGTECLIHADSGGMGVGQDTFNLATAGAPITVAGGYNNPNSNLSTASSISRSDSIVTVPVYNPGTNLCSSASTCSGTATVIGFLQLGIQDVVAANGHIHAVILNAAGCNPANSGKPVNGGGVSPIPVRLIQ